MAKYYIDSVKCGACEGGFACGPVDGPVIAEAKVHTDLGETFFLLLAEVDGMPNFYKSPMSTYDIQMKEEISDDEIAEMDKYFISTGEYCEYNEIFENPDTEMFQLYRYLIYLVRADWDKCVAFQVASKGKCLDDIDIPLSDIEEEYLEELAYYEAMKEEEEDEAGSEVVVEDTTEEDKDNTSNCIPFEVPESKEELFKMRLSFDAEVSTPSVFQDLYPDSLKELKKNLKQLKAACESETEYKKWKEAYLRSELAALKGKKFLACDYMFIGMNRYVAVIPESEMDQFKEWIDSNGSAFFTGSREATEDEVKVYIALNAVG